MGSTVAGLTGLATKGAVVDGRGGPASAWMVDLIFELTTVFGPSEPLFTGISWPLRMRAIQSICQVQFASKASSTDAEGAGDLLFVT